MSEFDCGWVEDETCENCKHWSQVYDECYSDNPGADGCWESEYEEEDE